jgi:PAP2 superfamily
MKRQSVRHEVGTRRSVLRPAPEALEARRVLSTVPMTVAMDPTANGMIGGIATTPVMVVGGQAMPDASVHLQVGKAVRQGHANSSGHYQFKLALPAGVYQIKVRAEDASGQAARASMTTTQGDAVLAWDAAMLEVIKADVANVGMASRTMAMVSGAVYDAVNDIERTGSVYKIDVKAPKGASPSAAASEAAYTILSALDPSMQPLLDVTMAQSLAAVSSARARQEGVQVGLEVAQGILAWRANDGSSATVPYVAGTAPGQWRPTPPTYQTAWGPEWGQVKTFAITRPASSFLPPPPPALNSPEYAAALNQVESLGALDSTTRTADQTQAGIFWAYDALSTGTPPVHYDQIAATVALQEHNTLTENARMFGLVNVAMGDAGIAAWDSKYTYNFWRPITAIRLADTDGNPATITDPTWTPLGSPGDQGKPNFTPPFPGYISGHAAFGSALFTVLARFYGTDNVRFTIGSDELPGVTRSYSSFSQASLENAWSRVYLGVHFWFDESNGLTLGASIGKNVFSHVMKTS